MESRNFDTYPDWGNTVVITTEGAFSVCTAGLRRLLGDVYAAGRCSFKAHTRAPQGPYIRVYIGCDKEEHRDDRDDIYYTISRTRMEPWIYPEKGRVTSILYMLQRDREYICKDLVNAVLGRPIAPGQQERIYLTETTPGVSHGPSSVS